MSVNTVARDHRTAILQRDALTLVNSASVATTSGKKGINGKATNSRAMNNRNNRSTNGNNRSLSLIDGVVILCIGQRSESSGRAGEILATRTSPRPMILLYPPTCHADDAPFFVTEK